MHQIERRPALLDEVINGRSGVRIALDGSDALGTVRVLATPALNGKIFTAVKTGRLMSQAPGAENVWTVIETGEQLAEDDITGGLGPVVSSILLRPNI